MNTEQRQLIKKTRKRLDQMKHVKQYVKKSDNLKRKKTRSPENDKSKKKKNFTKPLTLKNESHGVSLSNIIVRNDNNYLDKKGCEMNVGLLELRNKTNIFLKGNPKKI